MPSEAIVMIGVLLKSASPALDDPASGSILTKQAEDQVALTMSLGVLLKAPAAPLKEIVVSDSLKIQMPRRKGSQGSVLTS